MLDMKQIQKQLRDRRLSVLAEETGISHNTLIRVRDTGKASYDTAKALSDYLEETAIRKG